VVHGADKIAAQARAGARAGLGSGAVLRPVTVRGASGMLVLLDDRPISVIAFTVRKGLITEMRSFNDPERLAQIVPSWVARTSAAAASDRATKGRADTKHGSEPAEPTGSSSAGKRLITPPRPRRPWSREPRCAHRGQ
jgi:hypothetical protein